MLVLFTDFGLHGPYVGQLKAAIAQFAPGIPVIDLFHDIPPFNIQGAAYLLVVYSQEFAKGTTFIGVIDPGVGGQREGIIMMADERYYVGPDNGLFDRVAARAETVQTWHIRWRGQRLSASFHGRDIFAPVAAMLISGKTADQLGERCVVEFRDWPDELEQVVYIDRYGNVMTGIRASSLTPNAIVVASGHEFPRARTFGDALLGETFWYANSSGLVELAINQGSAASKFRLAVKDPVQVLQA